MPDFSKPEPATTPRMTVVRAYLMLVVAGVACQSLPTIDAPTSRAYLTVSGLTGAITIQCNGVAETTSTNGSIVCGPGDGDPDITIIQVPEGETCGVEQTHAVVCRPLTGNPNVGTGPGPGPSPTGVVSVGTVSVTVVGVLSGSSVSVAVNGNGQNTLTNGVYNFVTQGDPGGSFVVSIVGAGPGLSCTPRPVSGQLATSAVPVTVACSRALNLTQNQGASMVLGEPDFDTVNPGAGNALNSPRGVAGTGQTAQLYISDTGNARVVSGVPQQGVWPALQQLAATNPPLWMGPRRISINSGGAMAVADAVANKIAIYAAPPDAQALPLVVLGSGTPGVGPQGFSAPTAAFLLPAGMLVADRNNNRVLIYNAVPTDNTAQAVLVLGQPDMNSTTSACSANSMSAPEDVWSNGTYVAVADSSNNRALVWRTYPVVNAQPADIILGQSTMSTCSAGSEPGQMSGTASVAGDAGTLFAADTTNNRVLAYPWATMQTGVSASYALGQLDLSSSGINQAGSVTSHTLSSPYALGFWNSLLVVADSGNSRVLLYQSQ